MTKARFGTDGIRGVAGVDVTSDLARDVGRAAVRVLASGEQRPLVVVGRDTRVSGPELLDGLIAGLARDAGADVVDLGIIPTPAIALAVARGLPGYEKRPDFGVVISASHNPAGDNGIKLFGPGGSKLTTHTESAIEACMANKGGILPHNVSQITRFDATDWYLDQLVDAAGDLTGLKVVVDCANGAAGMVGPEAYRRAGADVIVINQETDGVRINQDCGATHLDQLRREVVANKADLGIAHDGDADRCLAVDAAGTPVDGDAMLAILAIDFKAQGKLRGDAIAATVMSNQGLVIALDRYGIGLRRTDVGDRAVLERIESDGLSLGGEQSGHIVLRDLATTGDGLLTALELMSAMARQRKSLAELANVMTRLPQVLVNVRVHDKATALDQLKATTDEVSAALGAEGRVLVRPSGTEPLIRIMVEAASLEIAQSAADKIAGAIELTI